MEKGTFTVEKSLTKWSNLLPVIEKIGIMSPGDITHDLPRIFSLKSKYAGKPQTNPNWCVLQKWPGPFKNVYIRKDRKGEGTIQE